jgi:hypothetical protein
MLVLSLVWKVFVGQTVMVVEACSVRILSRLHIWIELVVGCVAALVLKI